MAVDKDKKKNEKAGQIIAVGFFLILLVSMFKGLDEGFEYVE